MSRFEGAACILRVPIRYYVPMRSSGCSHLFLAAGAALLLSLSPAVMGCGPAGEAPVLEDLRCADESSCQCPTDPFTLELAVDFRDGDGDLGEGTYAVYIDGSKTDGPVPLLTFFEEAGLSPSATEGTLVLPAGLHMSGVYSGMTFVVGIQVTDAEGNDSNRPGIKFKLHLE